MDARVPIRYTDEEGFSLGQWVNKRRRDYHRSRLDADHTARLEAIPGWTENVWNDQWEEGYAALGRHVAEYHDCRVPSRYVDEEDFKLGSCVGRQRAYYREGRLNAEQIARLEAIDGWIWQPPRGRSQRRR